MNMFNWLEQQIYTERKKPLPVLTFPAVQYLYVTVRELVASSDLQAIGMRLIADKFDMPAAVAYMDLSVEAEAFGATCIYGADDVPTIIGKLVTTEEDADNLVVPEVGAGRTGVCCDAIKKAQMLITDRPVFAECIGPFSLAGRLMNVNDIMLKCYEEPEVVHKVLRKATDFIIKYVKELKQSTANGVIMAEPLAGLLSPSLMSEFSTEYVREIVNEVQDKHFIVIYHNCGSAVPKLLDEIMETGCFAFHFGESVDMQQILETLPRNYLILGNISAAHVFNGDSTEHVRLETTKLLNKCARYNNFLISSGCDIPPNVDLDNVNKFFETVDNYYYIQSLWNDIS
ncbi:MAG: uroporphyrinogen decarboxylase family protein [Oscillospiraceae bacterium]|nr:uroporphyrinogen decarboxylase family protein [Oscillospiraceae bacterium]